VVVVPGQQLMEQMVRPEEARLSQTEVHQLLHQVVAQVMPNNGSAGGNTAGGSGGTVGGGTGGNGSTGNAAGSNGTTLGGGGGGSADNAASTGGSGAAGQVTVTYTLPSPNATFYTAAYAGGCGGSAARFTISSSFFPTDANYTVTYSVSGTNTVASTTASMNFTAGGPGTGILSTAILSNAGGNTLSVTQITNSTGDYSVVFSPASTLVFNLTLCNSWYSYQTGNYNDFNTWTRDPSGATFDNPANVAPSTGDDITILNGFTVTYNVSNTTLNNTTIQGGGILNTATTTGHNLGVITGTGLLRVQGISLPSGTYTDFVSTLGGTIEYFNTGGNLPTAQTTYNKLVFSNSTGSNITYVLVSDLTTNGTLTLSTTGAGTVNWQINDASDIARTIVLNDDLIVGSGGRINVGTGNEVSTAPHALTMYGNITNNGIIKFYDATDSELIETDYGSSYPTPGVDLHRNELQGNAVTVTYLGTVNKTITCNNTTDFYRLVLNKGNGQIAKLTVNSSNTSNFRLFGPADLGSGSGTIQIPCRARNLTSRCSMLRK
jgi:fibronectin-binding autotransporter adhesin